MNQEITDPEQLEQYLKENLIAERMIKLSLVVNGKEYSEQVSIEQLFKVYERVLKREYIFATKIPPITLESLKQKILKDTEI